MFSEDEIKDLMEEKEVPKTVTSKQAQKILSWLFSFFPMLTEDISTLGVTRFFYRFETTF